MIRAVVALLCAVALAGAASAQEVELRTEAGGVVLDGTLLGYDGRFYRVYSPEGEVTVDGRGLVCEGACPTIGEALPVRISGTRSVAEGLLPPLIAAHAARQGYDLEVEEAGPDRRRYVLSREGAVVGRFSVHASTGEEGFADLIGDAADLVLSQREIGSREADLARQAGRGDVTAPGRSVILALDAVVPLVAPANSVEALSVAQIRAVATGRIDNWRDLGGPDLPIRLHVPDRLSGIYQAFRARVLQGEPLRPDAVHRDSPAAVAAAVAEDPAALGIGSFAEPGAARGVRLRGPCGLLSEATRMTIKTEDYPLTAPAFAYAPARRLPDFMRDFLDYATSPAAQSVIREAGFVDQFPESVPLSAQGERLATAIHSAGEDVSLGDLKRMAAALDGKRRLSLSFRFEGSSAGLDAQSRSNVALLGEAIEEGLFDGRTLLFAGFSDGIGAGGVNRRLSRERARAVRAALVAETGDGVAERVAFELGAFGEAMPMACDSTDWGGRVNRRVEVWLD